MSLNISLVPETGRYTAPAGSAALAQFQFVTFNATGQLVTPASGVFAVVLDDAPSLSGATLGTGGEYSGGYVVGVPYTYVFQGIQKVITGANLNAGVAVMSDNSGHAIGATGAGNVILGWTLSASSSGDIASVLLDRSLHN